MMSRRNIISSKYGHGDFKSPAADPLFFNFHFFAKCISEVERPLADRLHVIYGQIESKPKFETKQTPWTAYFWQRLYICSFILCNVVADALYKDVSCSSNLAFVVCIMHYAIIALWYVMLNGIFVLSLYHLFVWCMHCSCGCSWLNGPLST